MSVEDIHVTRWGTGPTVLMVHGGSQGTPSGGRHLWSGQRPLTEEGWELVMPDRPGHGETPSRGPEDYELDAAWVAELLGDGAHLVGHSYGGAIALFAAGQRPQAVRSLTLVEAPIFSVAPQRPEVVELRERLARASATRNKYLAIVRLMRAVNIPRELVEPKPRPADLRSMATHFKTMRSPDTWDATEALATVTAAGIPLLAVTGGWSPGFEAVADELVARTGGQRLRIAAGHHFPQLAGDPPGAELNRVLGSFLAGAAIAQTRVRE